jgi:hypothetical protein
MAINGKIGLQSFINYLVRKIKVFKNEEELNQMKDLFKTIFEQFDEGIPFA